MGNVPNVLIISPSKGIKTLSDFVNKAKAKPGSFNFASVGVGSAVHLSAERFRVSAGYEAVHVPYKGGAEALTEVIAGRIDYYFCPIATALPHIRDGRLLALAVSSPARAASLPDVPTTLESGFPIPTIRSGSAPSRRPVPRPTSCSGSIANADCDKGGRRWPSAFAQLGVEAMPLTSSEFGGLVAKEVTTYAEFRPQGQNEG